MITKRLMVAGTAGVALVLAAAMAAWACTSLATLDFEPEQAAPGEQVTVTGENFQAPKAFDEKVQPVKIRFGSTVGPVLATATPDRFGRIQATVKIPDVDFGGQYVILGTQLTEKGEPAFGTPARAALVVEAPAEQPVVGDVAAQPEQPVEAEAALAQEPGVSTWTWVALGLIGLTALILLGAGLGLFMREVRGRRVAPQRAER